MPFEKTVKNMQRRTMNIAADKHPQTNTVKILYESFFSFKIKHVNHVKHAIFFIHSSFFFKRLLMVIEFVYFTRSCDNWLMPGDNNRP